VKIRLAGPLKLPGQDADGWLEVPEGTTVRQVLRRAGLAGRLLGVLPAMVNGRQVRAAHLLRDRDVLVVVLPLSGG
jgi:sulfur carrier protein ThiS